MKQIIIGKEGSQPFAIQDPKVSRRHACLVIDDATGKMELIDNSSTNGTYIFNGNTFVRLYSNHPYEVTADTMIQLGPDTRFHVRRLLPAFNTQQSNGKTQTQSVKKEAPKPAKVDISHLRKISDTYNKNKMDLESKSSTINGLRSSTIIVSLMSGGIGGLLSENLDLGANTKLYGWVFSVLFAVILMAVLLTVISKYNRKIMERRNKNEHDYAVKYCCPKCGTSFRGKVYENILAERRCPKCKTEYYESAKG